MHPVEGHIGDAFSAFQLPKKEMHDLNITRYRVYSSLHEYVLVIADSAAEAMQRARMSSPVKVMREFPLYRTLLTPDWIGLDDTDPAVAAAQVAQAEAAKTEAQSAPAEAAPVVEAQVAPTGTAPAAEAPPAEAAATLSQEEINKLLES